MYINSLDEVFDSVINKFNIFLKKNNFFKEISRNDNFVRYHKNILVIIKKFISSLDIKNIMKLANTKNNLNTIIDILKRYCGFYIYLGICYNYKGSRNLFITNLVETAKNNLDTTYKINNLYNSENISKIVSFFTIIKHVKMLEKEKTLDRIKLVLKNNPIQYGDTINLFNKLGEDYVIKHFLIKSNMHSLIKTLIIMLIYKDEEKSEIIELLQEKEIKEGEYKYIEIVVERKDSMIDFYEFQKILSKDQILNKMSNDIYDYLKNFSEKNKYIEENKLVNITHMFRKGIIIPIAEDFLRYHKDSEKYDPELLLKTDITLKERDATKIKYITNKMNRIVNYHSPMLKNKAKIKINLDKYFYKPLSYLDAILYNDNEELKIIQKLEVSDTASDVDLLIDLESYRKYAYINYKHLSKDGIKIRPKKLINVFRYTNIINKKESKRLQIRAGNENLSLNIVGILLNLSSLPLNCFKSNDLKNIKNEKKINGFGLTIELLKKKYLNNNKNKNLYYWLFDNSVDKPTLTGYKNVSSHKERNINVILEELYNNFCEIISHKILNYIEKLDDISIWNINNLLADYSKKYIDLERNSIFYNKILAQAYKKIKILKDLDDPIDDYIPGKNNKIIRLPIAKVKKSYKNIIFIKEKEKIEKEVETTKNMPVCLHHIKYRELYSISRRNTDESGTVIFDFVKKYGRENKKGELVCKSCGEHLKLKKYVWAGTYIKDLDLYLTTNIAVNQNLHNIPKYKNLTRTIRNINKNIEKICFLTDYSHFLGNDHIRKLNRKMAIKDIIDLILFHTNYLKSLPNNRQDLYEKQYGLKKNYQTLFFFDLKDTIFLTSSTDTDYYKKIKFNNVLVYMIFIFIIEINHGYILSLKESKMCNYFIFEKLLDSLFSGIFLRVSKTEKIRIVKIPMLCYIIYYFSFILTFYKIWLWDSVDKEFNTSIQRQIIITVVELLNSLVESNINTEINYMNMRFYSRFKNNLDTIYKDNDLLEKMIQRSNDRISVKDKKLVFNTNKVDTILLNGIFKNELLYRVEKNTCQSQIKKMNKYNKNKINKNIGSLTHCDNGRFHKWEIKEKKLVCSLCSKEYDELKNATTSSDKDTKEIINNVRWNMVSKLVKNYCISGEKHDLDMKTNICKKCKINPDINKYKLSDLKSLDKNLERIKNEKDLLNIKLMEKRYKKKENFFKNVESVLLKLNNKFDKHAKEGKYESKMINYIDKFIKKLENVVGDRIKDETDTIYLDNNQFIIDHDYLGNKIKKPMEILSKDNKIKKIINHEFFKMDVIYYHDKSKSVFVYYNSISLHYLGYSQNNKTFIKVRTKSSLKVKYSIKSMIQLFGFESWYINLASIDKKYIDINIKPSKKELKNVITDLIYYRISHLKTVVNMVHNIIHQIKFRKVFKEESEYNEIVNSFQKKLKNFIIEDDGKKIFKNMYYFLSNNQEVDISIDNININHNYIFHKDINKKNQYDTKLIFYLIYNLSKLIDYNESSAIKTSLGYLVIRIIKFVFDNNYIKYNLLDIRKFSYYLNNPPAYVNESIKSTDHYTDILNQTEIDDLNKLNEVKDTMGVSGYYNELMTQEDIQNDDNNEREYNMKEEMDSLDIDDNNDNLYGDMDEEQFDSFDIDNS
jgi:hypothetical protein